LGGAAPVLHTLPGIVHRFAAGHQIQLVIAASDAAHEVSRLSSPVSVLTSPPTPSMLSLPALG
jgi:ABC-2 type transport system ATP-binding protein